MFSLFLSFHRSSRSAQRQRDGLRPALLRPELELDLCAGAAAHHPVVALARARPGKSESRKQGLAAIEAVFAEYKTK